MSTARIPFGIAFAVALCGCGNLQSIHHPFVPDWGTSISIDAKQRAIYTVEKTYRDQSDPYKITQQWRAICAEPSPDALTALSTAAAANAEAAGKALSGSFSSQEGAASIGLRTQTIQILRDAMYRLCEGYASGALDNIAFSRLQRRYQNIMMGLLAIEQITGTVVAKQVIISGSAAASVARTLAEIQAQLNDAMNARSGADAALAKAKTAKDGAEADLKSAENELKAVQQANPGNDKAQAVVDAKAKREAAKKTADDAATAFDDAGKAMKIAQANVQAYEELRKDLGKVATRAMTQGAFEGGGHVSLINAQTAQTLSTAVTTIVKEVVDRDYAKETCLDAITSRDFRALAPDQFKIAVYFCTLAMNADSEKVDRMQQLLDALPGEAKN